MTFKAYFDMMIEEQWAWKNPIAVMQGAIFKHMVKNNVDLIEIVVKIFGVMGCHSKVSIKVHILDSYLN